MSDALNMEVEEQATRAGALRRWIERHDESKLFLVAYIGLAVGLSLFVGLFWLAAVVFVHFGFELIRQSRHYQGMGRIAIEATWEIKLDIALVWAAIVLALYIDAIFGLLGLKSASQIARGASVAARAGVWQNVIRTFLITVDECVYVGRAVYMGRKAKRSKADREACEMMEREAATHPASHEKVTSALDPQGWTKGDYFSLGILVLMLGMTILAPWVTGVGVEGAWEILAHELHPFPGETLAEEMIEGH